MSKGIEIAIGEAVETLISRAAGARVSEIWTTAEVTVPPKHSAEKKGTVPPKQERPDQLTDSPV